MRLACGGDEPYDLYGSAFSAWVAVFNGMGDLCKRCPWPKKPVRPDIPTVRTRDGIFHMCG